MEDTRRTLRRAATLTALAIAALSTVVVAGLAIVASQWWSAAEVNVVIGVNAFHNVVFDAVAGTINVVFGPTGAALITVATLVGVIALTKSWLAGVRVGLMIAFAWGLADLVKIVVRRPRPDPALLLHPTGVEPSTFSYPSGHTAFAVAIGLAIALLFAGRRARAIALVCAAAVALVTAWSRVYLGVHFPTDVAASMIVVPFVVIAIRALTARMRLFRSGTEASRQNGARQLR
ncbi:phosphatase PAP2 family protein [Microbacterium sp.]|uniref:phosphatase PAP2 family protein n=1 Tax=Microbacterium sp. TaxID=51671 RepID=UPI003F6FAD9A